jgi:hypothetical protein
MFDPFDIPSKGNRARPRDRRFHLSRAHRRELLDELHELRPIVADRWNQPPWKAEPAVRRVAEIEKVLTLNGIPTRTTPTPEEIHS